MNKKNILIIFFLLTVVFKINSAAESLDDRHKRLEKEYPDSRVISQKAFLEKHLPKFPGISPKDYAWFLGRKELLLKQGRLVKQSSRLPQPLVHIVISYQTHFKGIPLARFRNQSVNTGEKRFMTLEGRIFDVESQEEDTIFALRKRVALKAGIPVYDLIILFDVKRVNTINDFNGWNPGTTLHALSKNKI